MCFSLVQILKNHLLKNTGHLIGSSKTHTAQCDKAVLQPYSEDFLHSEFVYFSNFVFRSFEFHVKIRLNLT